VKTISALTTLAVAFAVVLAVAVYALPRLLPALTVICVLAMLARAVWFYTR
jgi:hypothetical protein